MRINTARIKTMITALALLVNVNACAYSDTFVSDARVSAPVNQDKGQWAIINGSSQLMIGESVISEQAELLDSVQLGPVSFVATTVGIDAATHVYRVDGAKVESVAVLPAPDFLPETLCFSAINSKEVSLFIVDERGRAEHWLVYADGVIKPTKVRDLPVAPNSIACDADNSGGLFVVEEGVGIWRYESNPERPPGRTLVDLIEPRGHLAGGAEAISVVDDILIAVAADDKAVWAYRQHDDRWLSEQLGQWQTLGEAEALHARIVGKELQLVARDDELDKTVTFSVDYKHQQKAKPNKAMEIAVVKPSVQTDPVVRFGDAADDPAIWVHPDNPSQSRILGTDKKHGLGVYSLQGSLLTMLETGRLNNVDLRYGFDFGDGVADIAVASQRDHNSLSVYRIHPTEGTVIHKAELPTGLEEIYGLCMYQANGATYAIANGKSGRFEQHKLEVKAGQLQSTVVRKFALNSQPEGCVADDHTGRLFVGEEDAGIWTLSARPGDPIDIELVKSVDDELVADVEGLALYPAVDSRYLIVSSQGDDTYLVLNSNAPYDVVGKFSVGNNLALGIDAISETDGLEVTHRSLGEGLEFGAFIAQDGHNVMPEQPQNYKLVPWQEIVRELKLND